MTVTDEMVTKGAFAAWAATTPYAGRTLEDLQRERCILAADFGDGTTIEQDLLLDWELNRPTFEVLSRAVLESVAAS